METFHKVVTVGVDIQNDFCPGGALAVSEGDQVVEPFNQVARWTRDQGGQVILTADQHPAETKHFDKWPVHCVAGTEGAAFHPDLEIVEADLIISKGMDTEDDGYSGFEGVTADGRTLEEIIRTPEDPDGLLNRVALIVGGLATDYCVRETVVDANERLANRFNYPEYGPAIGIFVVQDAIRAVNLTPQDGMRAIEIMENGYGTHDTRFVTSQDIIDGKALAVET